MKDPFLRQRITYKRLLSEYRKHKQLIVAVDFDNTVFDYHEKGFTFPKIIKLLKKCNKHNFKLVVFSGSAAERHQAIQTHLANAGVHISGINTDVIDWHPKKELDWTRSKIYYNILLDDRAGLASAYKTLKKVMNKIDRKHKKI